MQHLGRTPGAIKRYEWIGNPPSDSGVLKYSAGECFPRHASEFSQLVPTSRDLAVSESMICLGCE